MCKNFLRYKNITTVLLNINIIIYFVPQQATSMYSDSGDDSCDEKMTLTIETIHAEGDNDDNKLVMLRPAAKMEPEHVDS